MELMTGEKECPACHIKEKVGRVLIKPDQQEAQTASGIQLIQSTNEEIQQWGDVIDISNDLEDGPVQPGKRVYFKKNHGDPYWIDGVYHLIIARDKLLAIA